MAIQKVSPSETSLEIWPFAETLEITGCPLCGRPKAEKRSDPTPDHCRADFGDYRGCSPYPVKEAAQPQHRHRSAIR